MIDPRCGQRTIHSCPHRRLVAQQQDEIAVCELLEEITGIHDFDLLEVSTDACSACCEYFAPTLEDLNPVVASLLYHLSDHVLARGGVAACDARRARQLNEFAVRSLPQVAPQDDDCVPASPDAPQRVREATCEQIRRLLPAPKVRCPVQVRQWAVGVTTAVRRQPTLEQCVDSLVRAGWSEPIVFIDGDVALPAALSERPQCHRRPAVGAFPNYMLSLAELYMREPYADAYLMLQDDALFLPSAALREYVEQVLWPGSRPGIVSLYCGAEYTQSTHGWRQLAEPWVWGAVAFAFSPWALRRLLTNEHLFQHRALPNDAGLKSIDAALGQAAYQLDIPIFYPTPSLVQHIGNVSSIWDFARAVSKRRADRFIGDLL